MSTLNLLTWLCDGVALLTALALLKDTLFDRSSARALLTTVRQAWQQARHGPGWPNLDDLRPAMRFAAREGLLVLVAASAGVCVVFPPITGWQGGVLRCALALYMASQVPCPWIRWVTIGDRRAKLNDPPGVERRAP